MKYELVWEVWNDDIEFCLAAFRYKAHADEYMQRNHVGRKEIVLRKAHS